MAVFSASISLGTTPKLTKSRDSPVSLGSSTRKNLSISDGVVIFNFSSFFCFCCYMSDGRSLLHVRRRLSAPGGRKSVGIVLKPEVPAQSNTTVDPCKIPGLILKRRLLSVDSACKSFDEVDRDSKAFPSKLLSIRSKETVDYVERGSAKRRSEPSGSIRFRASARESSSSVRSVPSISKFRGPIRLLQSGETLESYPCSECQRFADLLKAECVPEGILKAAFKHRYFCAPTSTPPNLWEPWDLSALPSSLSQDCRK